MDSVRFGRALGIGARSAAKALAGAVDAATDPNPARHRAAVQRSVPPASPPIRPASAPNCPAPTDPIAAAAQSAAKAAASAARQADSARKGLARGGKRFGESVWGPFARLSSVLWLEITGSFFAIFALFAASAVWTHRADLIPASHPSRDARLHLLVFLAMALVFAYFSISSFVRAYRK
jgi:hypothetical protein